MAMKDDGKSLADFMPQASPGGATLTADGSTFQAKAGTVLTDGAAQADREAIIEAIRTVEDPEIPVNLYDLGLIYRIDQNAAGDVDIDMTLTAPGCPVAGQMPGMVADAVAPLDGVGEVTVTLVWEPGWTRDMMSDDAKMILGIF